MSCSTRQKPGWSPEWDDTFRGYAINFIRENKWRCESFHTESFQEFEDHLQDAFLTFKRVRAAYPRVTEPKHFMSLFQTALRNEMIDKARHKKHQREFIIEVDDVGFQQLADRAGTYSNEGYLLALLAGLPPETRLALQALADEKKLALVRRKHVRSRLAAKLGLPKDHEDDLNAAICRALRLPRGTDLLGPLAEALTE